MKAPEHLKKNIFDAPDGYFEHLPSRIQERMQQEEEAKQTAVVSLPRWAYAAAASVLILLVAGIFFYQPSDSKPAGEQQIAALLAEVPAETMLEFLLTDAEVGLLQVNLTEEEQEALLSRGLDTYEIPVEDYEYEIYELEEYL